MSTLEQAHYQYPHPENLSRTEAMRHETGPVISLLTLQALQSTEELLAIPQTNENYHFETSQELVATARAHISEASSGVMKRLLGYKSPLLEAIPNISELDFDGTRQHLRALFYTYYTQGEDAIRRQIEDGIYPQMQLTQRLLLPAFLYAQKGSAKLEDFNAYEIADTLESADFKALLLAVTKTANGIWKDGVPEKYIAQLPVYFAHSDTPLKMDTDDPLHKQLIDELRQLHSRYCTTGENATEFKSMGINAKNLCVRNEEGDITISPFARQYLRTYLQFGNQMAHQHEETALDTDESLRVRDCTTNSIGCPVSVRSGQFPFHLVSTDALFTQFSGELQQDGSIVIPECMYISPEGKYTYLNPSPAIFALNALFANQIRTLAKKAS